MANAPRRMRVLVDRRPTNIRVGQDGAPVCYPDIAMCIDQESGYVFGQEILSPDGDDEGIVRAVRRTGEMLSREAPGYQPVWVVRDERLNAMLRAAFPGTPVLLESDDDFTGWDEAYLSMHHYIGGASMLPYLWRRDTSPEEVAEFFEAAASYYQARPWLLLPDDELLTEPDSLPDQAPLLISVLGASGISRGLGLFDSRADFECVLSDQIPESVAFVGFSPARKIPHTVSVEAEQHEWKIANQSAFPTLMRAKRGEPFPLRRHDLRRVTLALRLVTEGVKQFRRSRTRHTRR